MELTKEELALLWTILNQVNIPGSMAEIMVGLKVKVREGMQAKVGQGDAG